MFLHSHSHYFFPSRRQENVRGEKQQKQSRRVLAHLGLNVTDLTSRIRRGPRVRRFRPFWSRDHRRCVVGASTTKCEAGGKWRIELKSAGCGMSRKVSCYDDYRRRIGSSYDDEHTNRSRPVYLESLQILSKTFSHFQRFTDFL